MKILSFYLVAILFSASSALFAQSKTEEEVIFDSLKILFSNDGDNSFNSPDLFVNANNLSRKGLEIAKKNNNYDYQAVFYTYLIHINQNSSIFNFDSLVSLLNESDLLVEKNIKVDFKVKLLRQAAAASVVMNHYSKAYKYLLNALQISRESKNNVLISDVLGTLGNFYLDIGRTNKALVVYAEVLKIKIETNELHTLGVIYENIAYCFEKLDINDSALFYYKKAIVANENINHVVANPYLGVGSIYFDQNNFDSATVYINKGGEIARLNNEVFSLISYKYLESKLLFANNNHRQSLLSSFQALELCGEVELTSEFRMLYELISENYYKINKSDSAYFYLKKYKTLADSVNLTGEKRNYTLLEENYEIEKREAEIVNLSEQKKLQTFLIAGLCVFMILLGFYLYNIYKNLKKIKNLNEQLKQKKEEVSLKNEELEELNKTKDKFFSIVAHDLRNPFDVITGLTDVLITDFKARINKDIYELLTHINNSAQSAFVLMENLLKWSMSQTKNIRFNPSSFSFNNIINDVIKLNDLMIKAKGINLSAKLDANDDIFADKDMFSFVMRNVITNAVKYCDKEIRIQTLKEINNFSIEVINDGKGIGSDQITKLFKFGEKIISDVENRGTGLGLIICRDFVAKNNGTILVESDINKGFRLKIIIPVRNL